ncbi:putative tyrosinase-like protein tyr-3, partial [Bulinus truncatus]
TLRPNVYSSIASIHTARTNLIAHGGAPFLGWHRTFLAVYEAALRRYDPSVCLPYWDSTLDNQLPNPFLSSLWSPDFLGTPRGPVVDGPFANWRLPSGGQLIRNVAVDGDLMSTDQVDDILSRRSYDDIVSSTSTNPRYHIQYIHGAVHVYVGGTMTDLSTTAFDPAFYMHHAFIDYIFERFRNQLRSRGVNPDTYPRVSATGIFAPTAPSGIAKTTNAEGFSQNMASKASYEPVPTCSSASTTCGNRFLVCQLSTGLCIPTTRSATRSSSRSRRAVQDTQPTDTCQVPEAPTFDLPYQNDFCRKEGCDTSQFVMIPVKIVSVRPPNYRAYKSYPVTDNDVDDDDDIYSPDAYEDTARYISDCYGNLKTYSRCKQASSTGQIFIYSAGINYNGYYKESVIVDQKLTVSMSIGFVAVRNPCNVEGKVTKALIRAHDSCGRMCQITCRNPVTDEEEVCSGAVAVNEKKPLMYGETLNEAIKSVVRFKPNTRIPKFRLDNTYFTFYCDYSETFPFADLPDKVVPSI